MIKLEIPANNKVACQAFGEALMKIAASAGTVATMEVKVDASELREVVEEIKQDIVSQEMVESGNGDITEEAVSGEAPEIVNASDDTPPPPPVVEEQADIPPPPPPVVEEDGQIPWDERIHASTKAMNNDGSYKLRRKPNGMEKAEWDEYVQSVIDELKGDGEPSGEEVAGAFNASDDTPPPPPVVEEQVDTPPPPVNETTSDEPVSFPKFMKMITGAPGDRKANLEVVNSILPQYGVEKLALLNSSAKDQLPEIYAEIEAALYG